MKKKIKGDYLLLILVIAVAVFGCFMIYSASYYSAKKDFGSGFFFAKKQIFGLALGLFAMIFFAFFDYNKLIKIRWIALIVSLIALSLVFVKGLGVESYGAKRWISFFGITLQPSEIAKFGFILFSSSYIASFPHKMKTFLGVLPVLLSGIALCILIMIEPNMSITICMALLMLAMLFVGGIRVKHLLILLVPILILAPFLIIAEPYRIKRILAFLNPWSSPKGEGYQLLQSLYALGSGGFFGVGYLNSRQKFDFLPFSESDFILSVIGEEFGFFGCLILFSVYFLIIFRGYKIASKSKNLFGFLLSFGVSTILAIQTLLNILVVTGSIPPTGLPLPLISAGGSSLVVFMSAFGVLFNISKYNKEKN